VGVKNIGTELYYFSGTGNSLVVARDIAEKISGKLISIPSMMDKETITTDADVIGIVTPAYYMRIPRIVERFIGKLTDLQSKYIFVIVTVGGVAGGILDRLSEAIGSRGGKLAAGFVVRMPANYIHDAGALPVFLQKMMFRNWKKRADKIADHISNRKIGLQAKFNPVMTNIFSKRIDKQYLGGGLSPDIDMNFWTDNKCNGCRICLRVCPTRNIIMANDKPAWQHHCEKCLTCIQWCPKQAIQFKNVTVKRKRYHHPDVKLSDVLKWNEKTAEHD
jgi:ferredoxin/flavodoxin